MLRERLSETLKTALKNRQPRTISTVRLILAAIKDRDIAARGRGNTEGISDQDIFSVLQTMIRQREESIKLYEQGGRLELAQQEAEEIAIIEGFLPKALDPAAVDKAIDDVLAEIGAGSLRDMGRAMAVLRERFAGQMDFTKASARVRERLTALG